MSENNLMDWQTKQNQRMVEYSDECVERLRDANFPFMVSPQQAVAILEPSDAPENFYADGERSHAQALANWRFGLRALGLSNDKIYLAEKFIFGE